MALKTLDIIIDDEGRDKGKLFRITEMPALQGAKWAARALLALGRSGTQVPDDLIGGGMESLTAFAVNVLQTATFNDIEPLMDEMMRCVQVIPDPRHPTVVRPLVLYGSEGDDIEEIQTIFRLQKEAIGLHLDFFMRGTPSSGEKSEMPQASEITSTSPVQSASPSLRGKRRSTS